MPTLNEDGTFGPMRVTDEGIALSPVTHWTLVERWCESFKDDDFRLIFQKGDKVIEVSVGKKVYDAFGGRN